VAPTRDQLLEHFQQAEREATEISVMLRLAVDELRSNPDDLQVANVVRVAQTRSTRLTVQLLHTLTGCP
jgi:hypothetical protein